MKKISVLIMMTAAAAVLSASDSLDDELFSAARTGDSALVENLLDRGADANVPNENGWTPLMAASFSNEPDAAALLLSREADIDARENEGRTAFDIAASAGSDSGMDILLQAGAAP